MSPHNEKKSRVKLWVGLAALALLCLLVGWLAGRNRAAPAGGAHDHAPGGAHEKQAPAAQVWTCSMHPQIRQPGLGKCPICGMDLIPAVQEEPHAQAGPNELSLSPAAVALAQVETAPVERRWVQAQRRMVGKVAYDETRVKDITAWVAGRLDRLYVDYTGVTVRRGDHMVELYSPQLLTAQQELLQAQRSVGRLEGSSSKIVRETSQMNLTAAREKLRLLGLSADQIERIERSGQPSDHVTIYAPAGGIVVDKRVSQGAYVETGTVIYKTADLSQVWLMLEAYESDLPLVRYGQPVSFKVDAYPGQSFEGKVAFIAPQLDEATRSIGVRVNVPNERGLLKPGMFARAVLSARVGEGGAVSEPELAGKWICPMHPEEVKDGSAECDICGMPLVKAEKLGYAPQQGSGPGQPALVVPASAVLATGPSAVVYVADAERPGIFEARRIELGMRAGDEYLAAGGLREGERVVTRGAFKLDSAMQIQAKPSMMSPSQDMTAPAKMAGMAGMTGMDDMADMKGMPMAKTDSASEKPDAPEALEPIFKTYFALQQALSLDDTAAAVARVETLKGLVEKEAAKAGADAQDAQGAASKRWSGLVKELVQGLAVIPAGATLEQIRAGFALISEALESAGKALGTASLRPVYVYYCPMAFNNRGATWLQQPEETQNPYFGEEMFGCGGQVEALAEGE